LQIWTFVVIFGIETGTILPKERIVTKLLPDSSQVALLVALLALGIALGAVVPAGAAGPEARVRVFDPPESVEGPSRTGFVPPPGDFSHLRARVPSSLTSLPPRYDWRNAGVITGVRDQGNCGCCYAIAALGNFETAILIDGGGLWDFSVNNVKECDWWALNTGLASCSGGNASMVASFLSQKGIALESCDPFVAQNRTCKDDCPYYFTLTGWLQISGDQVAPTSAIKDYVYNNGPMFVAMVAANGLGWPTEFSQYDGSYALYYDGPGSLDHAVLIVGWDDTLSHAGGQGAWIVKNSWGTDWGEDGFFYIAYGSAQIGAYASSIYDWEPYASDGAILFHDDAGFMGTTLGYGANTAWALAKFVPQEPVHIERVEFWSTDAATDVDVYIYDGFSGLTLAGLLTSELNSTVEGYGYHSVQLSSPIDVSATNDIYVVVKITNDSYTFPIALDNYGPPSPGSCYVSPDGTTWTDVMDVPGCTPCAQSDVCIRVRGTWISTSGVIHVPGDYSTVSAAIEAADPGDTVSVGPGTYAEAPLTVNKDIVLMSEAGPESTVISAAGLLAAPAAGATVLSLVDVSNACQVIGLTFRGAQSAGAGGGIVITNSEPSIVECIVADNSAASGAGIMVQGSSPFIMSCTVVDNAGLSGIYFDSASSGLVNRCIVSGTDGGPGIYCNSASPVVQCCDLYGNIGGTVGGTDGGGSFAEDPMYCARVDGDYHLQSISPCLSGYTCGLVGALGEGCGSQVPAMLTSFLSSRGDESNMLTWVLPADPVEGAYIVYKTTGYPQGWEDGTAVENDMYGYFSGEAAAADTFYHTGLTNGQTYYYAAFAYNRDWKSAGGQMDSATPADVMPPGKVDYFLAQSGDSNITLSWTYPADEDAAGVMVRYSTTNYPQFHTDGSPVENGSGGVFEGAPGSDTSFVHSGLANGTTYLYSAFSYDEENNYSDAANTGGTPGVDDTPPGEVRSFVAQPSDSAVTLSWLNPFESDFAHTVIRYSSTAFPGNPLDGAPVENGSDGVFPAAPASADTFTHTGLENGATYYYTAFTVDYVPNHSNGVSVLATPVDATPPSPVTGLTASEGDGQATLRWTNPGDADFAGVRIVYSTVAYPSGPMEGEVANPGGTPAPADSFVHASLTNGTTYYYSVFAMDAAPNYSAAANAYAIPVDLTAPELAISVFRNPYLSDYLDIYVLASEALLLDSLFVTVEGTGIDMETSDADDYVYRGDYDIHETGAITIRARARDLALNEGSGEREFSSSLILASSGGAVRSADETFGLAVPPGAATRDGYVLVWERNPVDERTLASYEADPGSVGLTDYVRVEFSFDGAAVDPEHLSIEAGTGEGAVGMDTYVDAASGKMVAYAREFGVFSLVRDSDSVSRPVGQEGVVILHNSPNPFEHSTDIAFQVARSSDVSVDIVGIDGRVVRALHSGGISAGRHSIVWDGRDEDGVRVASGIYFVRVISPSGVVGRKVAVLR
jgi:C1A family cysteine protease